jgi:hypothetical protein
MLKFIFSFALLYSTASFAQKHELSLDYRFGIDVGGGDTYNSVLSASYDHGVTLQFKYRIWNKAKLYFMLGYDQSSTKYSIYDDIFGKPEKPYPFNVLNVNRHGLHFGLNKKFEINKFTIDIGINCATRTRIYKNFTSSAEGGFHEPAPLYRSFNFETQPFYRDIGLEYNVDVSYSLFDNFSLNMGITHSRGHFMEYDSYATLIDATGAITTSQPNTYYEANNFLYLKAGIIYKL